MSAGRRPVSRRTQGWLLLAQVAIVLPLSNHCTPWTLAILGLCLLWRLGIFFGRVARPPRWLVNLLGLGALVTLGLVVSQVGVLAALINLLVLAYGLKTIEIRHHGDLTVVVLTGFFLIALHMLDRYGPGTAVHLVVMVVLNTQVLLSVYRPGPLLAVPSLAIKMVLMSLPLALLLFLLVPRIGPLWQMHGSQVARTGLTDSLALGQIAQLGRSGALAFRASFDGPLPEPESLYWRAVVMDEFDGQVWRASDPQTGPMAPPTPGGQPYQLLVEPSHQPWLPTLNRSYSADPRVGALTDQRLIWALPPAARQQLALTWSAPLAEPGPLDGAERLRLLALPSEGNPRARDWAWSLTRAYDAPQQRIAAVLQEFRQAPYRYTLSPPALGHDQIDSFLFDTRAGFCGHYASALVFLARAAGIPARMVAGYQGGDPSPDGTLLTVYQFNAHAWVEVHIEGLGWVRVDPTAAVAPERVEQGPEAALGAEPAFLADARSPLMRWREVTALRALQSWMTQLDYRWSQWVLGFDQRRQADLWQQWFGRVTLWHLGVALAAAVALVALVQAWLTGLWRWPRPRPAPLRSYDRMVRLMRRHHLAPHPGEAPLHFARRIGQQRPDLAPALQAYVERFHALRYAPKPDTDARALAEALSHLQQHLERPQGAGFTPVRSSASRT
ncbi:DUF3488 and DUF4129 domain-containing transglutaminase family protein [Ferrimonas balearica]|uniref:transglutaminase TgpA family protein n=1 Tax=Ferrimonas balearica TaxID=44012 RepID=UPI001C99E239|nr:DUF3488 and transglutaminase-like domain-containing protein [Ferrimonas balearica]MBY5991088.1 DUF3488 and transglutaminase-like domain-containing protein [Ferrimonas balearica]